MVAGCAAPTTVGFSLIPMILLYLYIKFPNKFKKICLKQDHLISITLESLYLSI